jgi:serine/threonine-protein phosphatase PGAM5
MAARALMTWLSTLSALSSAPLAEAADPPAAAAQGNRYLYLIRHGYYVRVDSLDEKTANGINDLGAEQAALLGKRLAGLPVKFRALLSSDLLRARQTADRIGAILGMAVEPDTLLEECTPSSSRPGFDQEHDAAEMAACQRNLEAVWTKYFRPSPEADTHDLVVCHGNVIRWLVQRAMGDDVRNWTTMDIGNASLTVVAVRPDETARLVIFSDVGHLPVEKQTWVGRGPGWSKAAR